MFRQGKISVMQTSCCVTRRNIPLVLVCVRFPILSHISAVAGYSWDLRSKGTLFEGSVEMFSVSGFPTRIHFHGPLVLSFGGGWEQRVLSTCTLSADLCQACKTSGCKPVLPELTSPPASGYKRKEAVCPSFHEGKRSCFLPI